MSVINLGEKGEELSKLEVQWVDQVPGSEFSLPFIQHMANSMGVSFFKYGKVTDAKGRVDILASLKKRLDEYERSGNTEWLVDVANFAMMEFMVPSIPGAYFEGTDSSESPGRKFVDDRQFDKVRKNLEL